MKKLKRVYALLLCVAMLLSTLPMEALAAGATVPGLNPTDTTDGGTKGHSGTGYKEGEGGWWVGLHKLDTKVPAAGATDQEKKNAANAMADELLKYPKLESGKEKYFKEGAPYGWYLTTEDRDRIMLLREGWDKEAGTPVKEGGIRAIGHTSSEAEALETIKPLFSRFTGYLSELSLVAGSRVGDVSVSDWMSSFNISYWECASVVTAIFPMSGLNEMQQSTRDQQRAIDIYNAVLNNLDPSSGWPALFGSVDMCQILRHYFLAYCIAVIYNGLDGSGLTQTHVMNTLVTTLQGGGANVIVIAAQPTYVASRDPYFPYFTAVSALQWAGKDITGYATQATVSKPQYSDRDKLKQKAWNMMRAGYCFGAATALAWSSVSADSLYASMQKISPEYTQEVTQTTLVGFKGSSDTKSVTKELIDIGADGKDQHIAAVGIGYFMTAAIFSSIPPTLYEPKPGGKSPVTFDETYINILHGIVGSDEPSVRGEVGTREVKMFYGIDFEPLTVWTKNGDAEHGYFYFDGAYPKGFEPVRLSYVTQIALDAMALVKAEGASGYEERFYNKLPPDQKKYFPEPKEYESDYSYTPGDLSFSIYIGATTGVEMSTEDASAFETYMRGSKTTGAADSTGRVHGSGDGKPENQPIYSIEKNNEGMGDRELAVRAGTPIMFEQIRDAVIPGLQAEAEKFGITVTKGTANSILLSVDNLVKFSEQLNKGNTQLFIHNQDLWPAIEVMDTGADSITDWSIAGLSGQWKNAPTFWEYDPQSFTKTEYVQTEQHVYDEANGTTTTKTVTEKVEDPISYQATTVLKKGGTFTINTSLDPKFKFKAQSVIDTNYPSFHSVADPAPHTEMNQGTIKEGATGPTGAFNSMTGTPTFTATEDNSALDGWTQQGKTGHYYQYFAAGGSEFVVEFDGIYHHNETATRNFTFNWTGTKCALDGSGGGHAPCEGAPNHPQYDAEGNISGYGTCGHSHKEPSLKHHQCGTSNIAGTSVKFSITYTGLDYVEITNLQVWELSAASVDGTRELLSTDKVTATVQNTAPAISYNIAGANTSEAGRLVYEFCPTGAKDKPGAFTPSGDRDNLVWTKTTNNTCTGYAKANLNEMKAVLNGAMDGAYMVSDYIVLHTTAGDQSIMYFEKPTTASKAIVSSYGSWADGTCKSISTDKTSTSTPKDCTIKQTRNSVEFKATSNGELWESNKMAAAGAGYVPEGVTYGGYNGDWSNRDTKYTSTATNKQNITWSTTQAGQNKSGVYGTRGRNKGEFNQKAGFKPSSTLRLMNDKVVIPDSTQNGLYEFKSSMVYYKNIVSYTKDGVKVEPGYPIKKVDGFAGEGFSMTAGYGSSTYPAVCNGIVVYNPISIEDSRIVPLPADRDQRLNKDAGKPSEKVMCPGDNTCPYQELDCAHTGGHLHTAACYTVNTYVSHTGYNTHEHTEDCGSVVNTKGQEHIHCINKCRDFMGHCTGSGCSLCASNTPFANNTFPDDLRAGDVSAGMYVPLPTGGNAYISSGSGKYIYKHGSGCEYENEYHASPYPDKCSCDHASCVKTPITTCGRTCGDQPLNTHVCVGPVVASAGKTVTLSNGSSVYIASGSGKYIYKHGSECSFANEYHASPYSNKCSCSRASCVTTPIATYEDGSGCRTVSSTYFKCTDPHHTWDTDWHFYTLGMVHASGKVCTGTGCTDTSNIQFRSGDYYSVADIAKFHRVSHGNTVHISKAGAAKCTTCGLRFVEDLGAVTSATRVLTAAEIKAETGHYQYGNSMCWSACNNPDNHTRSHEYTDANGNSMVCTFVNLDWPVTLEMPNTGDFYGTGNAASDWCSAERGMGYTDDMDTTQWFANKYVEFPFDVVYEGVSYSAHTPIPLCVYQTFFEFYIPLENSEAASVPIRFYASAINDPIKSSVGNSGATNISILPNMSHPHDAVDIYTVDVVGRIGALTMNDTQDFRFSNFFKQTLSEWMVPNVLRRVDTSKQQNIVTDSVDVRGVPLKEAYFASTTLDNYATHTNPSTAGTNTYGSFLAPRSTAGAYRFPLMPSYLRTAQSKPYSSNQEALADQPTRVGYSALLDFTTLGNYYGSAQGIDSYQANPNNADWCNVKPHYYRMDITTGELTPADVYMYKDGEPVLINDADATLTYKANQEDYTKVSLNWTEEAARRNYYGVEAKNTDAIYDQLKVGKPTGSSWYYGNYDTLLLTGRNRTCIGQDNTYGLSTDPGNIYLTSRYWLQGARWHSSVGLPSSAVFVQSGKPCTSENIKSFYTKNGKTDQYVVVVALEIYAYGEVWNLVYDGKNINSQGVKVTDNTPTVTPHLPGEQAPPTYPGKPDKEMPIVSVISINHSSKEDIGQAGTH